MAISRSDVFSYRIQCRFGTIGGPTYYLDGDPVCFSNTRSEGREGMLCSHGAGFQTNHNEEGRCYLHSGRAGRPPVTGRYASIAKRQLRKHYEEFYNDPDLMDITAELSLQRSLLAQMISGEVNQENLVNAFKMLNDITKTVERIHKIESRHVLTTASARLMMVTAVKLIEKYIPEEDMELFLTEWRKEVEPSFSQGKLNEPSL